jgi:hypothetical protein
MNDIIEYFKFFKSCIEDIGKSIDVRNRNITFKDIVYFCMYKNGNSYSYTQTNIKMQIKNLLNVSDQAIIKKRNSINPNYFKKINNKLLNYAYINSNEPRLLAVDGTYLPVSVNLNKYGYRTSKKKRYCSILNSCVLDVNNYFVVDYHVCKNYGEQSAVLKQINCFKENDIVLFDRNYFSYNLIKEFNKINAYVVIRLKINLIIVEEIDSKGQTDMITKIYRKKEPPIKFRVLKYKIDGDDYYLGTTIFTHTVSYFIDLYHKRWSIETHFKESKYVLSLMNLTSTKENELLQDVYVHSIISIIKSFINNMLQDYLDDHKKINSKILIDVFINDIMHMILYNSFTINTKNEIDRLLNILVDKAIVVHKENRHYNRLN